MSADLTTLSYTQTTLSVEVAQLVQDFQSCADSSSFLLLLLAFLALLRRLDPLQSTQEAVTEVAHGPQLPGVRVSL